MPGEIFVRLVSKSVNSGELPCGFGRTWLGKVSQGLESLCQRLKDTTTSPALRAAAIAHIHAHGRPINYEKKSITNCGLHPLLSQNQGVIWLGAIYKKKGKLKKIKIEGRLIPPSLRRACEAPGKCEREKNPNISGLN